MVRHTAGCRASITYNGPLKGVGDIGAAKGEGSGDGEGEGEGGGVKTRVRGLQVE